MINVYFRKFLSVTVLIFVFSSNLSADNKKEKLIFNNFFCRDSNISADLIDFVRKNKPEEFVPLLSLAILQTGDSWKRSRAFEILKIYSKSTFLDVWLEILKKSGSFVVKKDVIEFLTDVVDQRTVKPFAEHLKSPFSIVRRTAALALKKSGDDRMYPVVLQLAGSSNPAHRIYALEAFNFLYDRRFFSTVKGMLYDHSKSVRIYALQCVEKNNLRENLFRVRNIAANDRDTEVRVKAIKVLTAFNDRNSLYSFLGFLSDKNRNVRYAAANSLYKMHLTKSVYTLSNRLFAEDDDEIKEVILETLGRLKKIGDMRGIRKILTSDSNFRMRSRAAYVLGVIRDKRAVKYLVQGLNDKDYRVRGESGNSLGNFEGNLAVSSLLKALKTDRSRFVRSAALFSLKRINRKKVLIRVFDVYSVEEDPVFREMLRSFIKKAIGKYI